MNAKTAIIETLRKSDEPLTIKEISIQTGYHVATIRARLNYMARNNRVNKTGDGHQSNPYKFELK